MERRQYGDGTPTVSVVVPSVPASDHDPTLACLADQTTAHPYEVLLVEDATIDRSVARNRGLRAAAGDVVAFTDDDTRPSAAWIETARAAFAASDRLVCLEGPVFGGAVSDEPRRYVGCNLAVDPAAALAVGGFRSAFSEWGEDIEFGWRMERDADGRCRFDSDFRMCHPTAPRTPLDLDLERQLRREYPDRYAAVLGDPVTRLKRYGRAVGLLPRLHRLRVTVRRRLLGPPCPERRVE
ncbi:MAG: glycosyltransferase family 2 protein [Halobaculum sp.]